MKKDATIIIGTLCLIMLAICLSQPKAAFAKNANEPCPCEDEYKSEPGYDLYKQATKDWKAKKWQKAVEKYQKIIEKHPESPLAGKAYIGTGLFLKFNRLYDQAIPEFEKGISMLKGTRSARDAETSVACIYTAQGKYDKALRLLRKVISNAKDWDEIKFASYWAKEVKRRKSKKNRQTNNCGVKALATVMRLKGIKSSQQELAKTMNFKGTSASMQQLEKAATAKKLKVVGIRTALPLIRNENLPAIALVKPNHYVVISAINDKQVTVIDSSRGERSYEVPIDTLAKRWTGKVLFFSQTLDKSADYTFLTKTQMESSTGSVCDCCPEGGLGGRGDNPNTEFVDPVSIWVNTVNLNMTVGDTDLSYDGLGLPVEVSHTYNGDDPRQGPFGRSWTSSYEIFLIEEPSGDVLVHRGSGKIDRFYYVGGSPTDMSSVWQTTFTCTDSNCPDWTGVGDVRSHIMYITQDGNNLTAFMPDPSADLTGSVDGNSFSLTGSFFEDDEGCLIDTDLSFDGFSSGDSLTATVTAVQVPQNPEEPNCTPMIGLGCTEVFDITGIRKSSQSGYITYESGLYDTLTKNPGDTWTLQIKKNKTSQHFDSNGVLTSIVDRNGNFLTFGYDTGDKLTSITDAAVRVTTFSYDAEDHIVSITDPIGRSTSYTYDSNDNLTTSTDTGGHTTTAQYPLRYKERALPHVCDLR